MRKLPKLWRSLERISGHVAVQAVWETECGEDFPFLRLYLRPTEEVGHVYPCPNHFPGCPRRIIDYGNSEFVAICNDRHKSCNRVPLAPLQALTHDIDLAAFFRPVLQAASIRTEGRKLREWAPGVWSLGLSARRSSLNQPAFLIIAHSRDVFDRLVCDLLLDGPGHFVLVTPTSRYRSVKLQRRLQARNITYLSLEEQLLADDHGGYVAVEPLESTDAVPVTPIPDRKRAVREFTQKHRCKVADIQKAAGVYETDYYGWLNGQDPDHYAHSIRIERILHRGLPKANSPEFS